MRLFSLLAVLALPGLAFAQKDAAVKSAAAHADANWPTALKIWEWAEPGYQEKKSADALAAVAEKAGFKVTRGVAKIPTAFTAEFGTGKPVIGILGEFDALPELSQEAVPFRQPRKDGNGNGHACGHHLFGTASLSASIAIAEQIKAVFSVVKLLDLGRSAGAHADAETLDIGECQRVCLRNAHRAASA